MYEQYNSTNSTINISNKKYVIVENSNACETGAICTARLQSLLNLFALKMSQENLHESVRNLFSC